MESRALINSAGTETLSGHAGPVPWWSFTKTALAIAALRLVEDGRLALDKPLPGRPFSLAQLLRHEAGLPDYGGLPAYHDDVAAGAPPWSTDRLLAETDAARLRYPPGEGWAYSNIGYLEVAQVVSAASDLALGEALRTLVFAPAGLTAARLALTPEDLADVAMGGAPDYHPGWVYHGLVVGPAIEAARLLRALITGALLSPETFAAMLKRRALPGHRSALHPDPAYALGLMLRADDPLNHPLGHTGGGPGSGFAAYARGCRVVAIWTDEASGLDATTEAFAALEPNI